MTCERTAIDAGQTDGPRSDAAVDTPLDAFQFLDAAEAQGPQLVQQKGRERTAVSSSTTTLDTLPIAGNTLVVIGGGPVAPLVSVSGGGVTTWTRAAFSPVAANVEIWFGVTDGSSAAVTITAQSAASSLTMLVTEWSGLAATNALDGTNASSATSSPASAGSITTANAHDVLLFAVSSFTPNTFGSVAGYTGLTSLTGVQTGVSQVAWYREVTTTGTYTPSVSVTSNEWDACVVALKAAP